MPEPTLIRVEPIALMPTQAGCAVFLGDGQKAIVFYTEPGVGAAINSELAGVKAPRPLTHDLFTDALKTFGAKVTSVIITDFRDEVFYARLYIEAENEVMEHKIVELDSRPSDAIALAVRAQAPVYFSSEVWQDLKDMSDVLEEMRSEGIDQAPPL